MSDAPCTLFCPPAGAARPRPADLASDERERDQAARVVGAVDGWEIPSPEDDRALAVAYKRATSRIVCASTR